MLGCARHQMEAGKEHKIHENFSAKPKCIIFELVTYMYCPRNPKGQFFKQLILDEVYSWVNQRLDRWQLTEGKKGFKT